ncbi:permease [Nesterenkonia marinintestina]|uniref:permease n=1 Tax=Nesterenkonia marinintestina TaxID=2979865 RepID=UPI0021BEC121|nr:permease [Nesterenkonia sp. GX14115]
METRETSQSPGAGPHVDDARGRVGRTSPASGWIGVGILTTILVLGLGWSKWIPYVDRIAELSVDAVWDAEIIFAAAGETPSLGGAWDFTLLYFAAVWKALVVAMLAAAAIDALVPRDWLVRLLNRASSLGQAMVGAVVSLPSMMCTCCAAPVAAGLRRSGVSTGAAMAYWVGNPLLNPAVLVFLLFVLPWEFGVVRLVVGIAVTVGAAALIGRLLGRSARAAAPVADPQGLGQSATDVEDPPTPSDLPGRYVRSLGRFARIMLPEHLLLVFLMGLLLPWLTGLYGLEAQIGAAAILLAAVVGMLLVIPTGGEIPVIIGLTAVGVGAGTAGALLVTLPALSLPSIIMVGKYLGWRATSAMAAAVVVGGILSGAAMLVLV